MAILNNIFLALCEIFKVAWMIHIDSYTAGYAVTSGYFYERNRRYHVSGAPRAADLVGKVFIYTFPRRSEERMSLKSMVKGEQQGEYFGSSLTACDINNDGRDDLVIGAPLWTRISDEGRIYVLISRGQVSFFCSSSIENHKIFQVRSDGLY